MSRRRSTFETKDFANDLDAYVLVHKSCIRERKRNGIWRKEKNIDNQPSITCIMIYAGLALLGQQV